MVYFSANTIPHSTAVFNNTPVYNRTFVYGQPLPPISGPATMPMPQAPPYPGTDGPPAYSERLPPIAANMAEPSTGNTPEHDDGHIPPAAVYRHPWLSLEESTCHWLLYALRSRWGILFCTCRSECRSHTTTSAIDPVNFKLGTLIHINYVLIILAQQVSGQRSRLDFDATGTLVFHTQLLF